MFEFIRDEEKILALIVRAEFAPSAKTGASAGDAGSTQSAIEFFTPNDFSQQVAAMVHPRGKVIAPHVHNRVDRNVTLTQEVLFIKKGKLRVDLYRENQEYLESRVLGPGDTILLATGGHGFEVVEDVSMIEVKQGPYAGEADKRRFEPIHASALQIKATSTELPARRTP